MHTLADAESMRQAAEREKPDRAEGEQLADFARLFNSILGHDLRNPLSAIKMGAQMLLSSPAAPTDERTKRIAGRVVSSADRMTRMIEELLDFTRVHLGAGLDLTPSLFNLGELIADLAEEIHTTNSARQLNLEKSGDLVGSWDRDRLTQVFSNLLANAAVHGDVEVPVTVVVRGDHPRVLTVDVKNGGAIPPEVLPEICKPFKRGAFSARKGLGLGLYIADEIVRLHGGKMTFTSTPEAGTCFSVSILRSLAGTDLPIA